jgi:hypothetical protein
MRIQTFQSSSSTTTSSASRPAFPGKKPSSPKDHFGASAAVEPMRHLSLPQPHPTLKMPHREPSAPVPDDPLEAPYTPMVASGDPNKPPSGRSDLAKGHTVEHAEKRKENHRLTKPYLSLQS